MGGRLKTYPGYPHGMATTQADVINADILAFLRDGFTNAAMAKVGTSAIENRRFGYLLWSDVIVPHRDELLHVASAQAKAMHDSGYRPPARTPFPVAGRSAIATIKARCDTG